MTAEQLTPPAADRLDRRPALSAPDVLTPEALADARAAQPRRGLAGLLFVLPATVVLAAAVGGPTHSLQVLGPIVTCALPTVAMIAFWWEDWPGSLASRGWSGLYDTAVIAAGGLGLTLLAQLLVNGPDLAGIFVPAPGRANAYPAVLPLAGGIFTITLQLTLVCERWPLAGLGRIRAGLAALAACWLAGLLGYVLFVRSGLVPPPAYGAWMTVLVVWQLVFYVALRGWPFARIRRRPVRLTTANLAVTACAALTYPLARLAAPPETIGAIAGAAIASVLVVAMLFEAWPAIRTTPLPGRSLTLVIIIALTALLSWLVPILARALGVADVDGWVTHTTLNALSLAVILHVVVWRRWLPLPARR